MNYNDVIEAWLNLLETDPTETEFIKLIPRAIEATELRIWRDLDFLTTVSTQIATLATGNRNVAIPTSIIIVHKVNVVTPATATTGDAGTRNPLQRVSTDFLDAVWPSQSVTGIPQYYAILTDATALVGPAPNNTYTAEFVGTVRPAQLSPTNTTNFLSLNMPDLYIAAGMVFWSAYYQNYGAAVDDPKIAMTWESRYTTLFAGINTETMRAKAKNAAA